MKAISAFMLLIMFFSLFKPVRQNACCCMQTCPYMSGKIARKPGDKKENKGDCQNCRGCNSMVPVPAPVYVPIETIKFHPCFTVYVKITFPIYQLGELPSYSTSDWKPPKC